MKWQGNNKIFRTYVRGDSSGSGKKPAEKVKGRDHIHTFEEVEEYESFGAVLNQGIVDISFDSKDMYEAFLKMAEGNGWRCLCIPSQKGGHTYWRIKRHIKNGSDKRLAVGLVADIHSGDTYIPLKVKGVERYPPDYDIYEGEDYQELPPELLPLENGPSFWGMKEGGRNTVMYSYILPLKQRLRLSNEEIISVLHNINDFILDDPLPDTEMETICREEAFPETTDHHDLSDVGQAQDFKDRYGSKVIYHPAVGFNIFDGVKWVSDDLKAQQLAIDQTDDQMRQIKDQIIKSRGKYDAAIDNSDGEQAGQHNSNIKKLQAVQRQILKRRDNGKIKGCLEQVKALLSIDVTKLDKDPFLLNTPGGTVDLRTGVMKDHNAYDYCTKITAKTPSDVGSRIFQGFLDTITGSDRDLQEYIQMIAGMAAVGKVFNENLIIAYGDGGNGKSTFFNLLFLVMGDYSGMLQADTLTTSNQNKKTEYADLRGKRLVIAAELEEGKRLDSAAMKKLCSTDPVKGERKYKDSFTFLPSHTTVLYTNHLPKVGNSDTGTWRRLIVIPFKQRIAGSDEKKNYTDYLFQECGEAVMKWICEGARKYIEADYKLTLPECVVNATEQYKDDNDWLGHFIDDCCIVSDGSMQKAADLHICYKTYCNMNGEFLRTKQEFGRALEAAGYMKIKRNGCLFYLGIYLKNERWRG